jgi:capsular exopolysaccharide synthesis family protein
LRHRKLILITTVLFLVGAFIYVLAADRIYVSQSRLYVNQGGPRIISDREGMMTRSKSYLYTQAEMIKSTPVIGEVVDDPEVKRFKTFRNTDNPAAYLQKNVDVRIGKKDDIISVAFDSPYPAEAARIVNAVVDAYVDSQSVRKKDVVSRILKILQDEKAKSDKDLSGQWQKIVDFTTANGAISFENDSKNVVYQKLLKLSDAVTECQLSYLNSRADWEAVKAISDDPVKVKHFAATYRSGGNSSFIRDNEFQLESELRKTRIELESLKNHVTDEHPAVKAINAKIELIESDIKTDRQRFCDTFLAVLEQKWKTFKEKEDTLLASYDAQRNDAQSLGVKATEYAMLQSELRRAERFDEVLDERIKKLNVLDTDGAGKLDISILEVARPAENPSQPRKARIMAIALILGLMCGTGLALGSEWMDVRLHSVDEIAAVLGLPVLGVVPTMTEQDTLVDQGRKAWLNFRPMVINACHAIGKVLPPSINSVWKKALDIIWRTESNAESDTERRAIVDRGQKVYLEPKSVIAEAYRTIRTAVFFGIGKGKAKTILVTSPESGDGKSTLVSNLALSMAQAGQKTLIVDADFRRPRQHTIFDFTNEHGLSSVLSGATRPTDAIRPGPVLGLDIMGCGPEVPNPSEILNSEAFVQLLNNELCTQYARIIIDSPPVGPVADSQILAAVCDATLLVLRAEKSTKKSSSHACEVLRSVGGHLPGVVVNDVPRKGGYSGYYSPYGYQYGTPYMYRGRDVAGERTEEKEPVRV